ncbi:hypothetical protein TIFTF001_051660 [Ficus carica]|uniref:Late embryogenesis abundant protein LEA-2 subgroup domain-containing protein n=1 Tax=Ficus carica TaxID=3494 RepID=A0AA87ZBG0_FICCA|nr:hypothetical protein TIFTF001_051660 [Ficus carica]
MTLTIDDHRNVESFKFKNATAYVNYREDVMAEVPIRQNLVPTHGKLDVTTSADLLVSKIIRNLRFYNDIGKGSLKLTATTTLHGKASAVYMQI